MKYEILGWIAGLVFDKFVDDCDSDEPPGEVLVKAAEFEAQFRTNHEMLKRAAAASQAIEDEYRKTGKLPTYS